MQIHLRACKARLQKLFQWTHVSTCIYVVRSCESVKFDGLKQTSQQGLRRLAWSVTPRRIPSSSSHSSVFCRVQLQLVVVGFIILALDHQGASPRVSRVTSPTSSWSLTTVMSCPQPSVPDQNDVAVMAPPLENSMCVSSLRRRPVLLLLLPSRFPQKYNASFI